MKEKLQFVTWIVDGLGECPAQFINMSGRMKIVSV